MTRFLKRQHGQGMIEYVIVTAAVAIILLIRVEEWDNRNAIEVLADAIKGYYHGYAYAVSMSELPDMATDAQLVRWCQQQGRSRAVCENSLELDNHAFAMELLQGQNLAELPGSMPTPDWESILLAGFNAPETSSSGGGGETPGWGPEVIPGVEPPPETGGNTFLEERSDGFWEDTRTGEIIYVDDSDDGYIMRGITINASDEVIGDGEVLTADTISRNSDGTVNDEEGELLAGVTAEPFGL